MVVKKLILIGSLLLTPVCLWAQNRYAVVISEIMADPIPAVGLPAYEWIELKNTSAAPVSLQGWRIADASGQSGPLPSFLLQPDSVLIICSSTALSSLLLFGSAVAVSSFPSLDNDGETVVLKTTSGITMHAVQYSASWYQNELKMEGGWSLEMIDPLYPCAGMKNWKASTHPSGGTPGKINSVNGSISDNDAPLLQRAYPTDSTTIQLVFSETLDSSHAANINHYTIDGGININSVSVLPPLFNTVQLKTNSPLSNGMIYTVSATQLKDCAGNTTGNAGMARVGIPEPAEKGDCIINEILFNPRSNAWDYVEGYNRSKKIVDASKLYIANRNSSGMISSLRQLSPGPFLLFPGDYFVVTENAASLAHQYLVKQPDLVFEISSLPSFPDDEGTVVIVNGQGIVTDEVHYRDDWHFKLIADAEGVALERVDPEAASQEAGNWHSAASTAGFGTPTYKNSQYKSAQAFKAILEPDPPFFSPDNDGREDITSIRYKVAAPGYVATIIIFDAAGRPVRHLVRNATLGPEGSWNWDGLDEKGQRLPVGTYIVWAELFDLKGNVQRFKKAVVLARKLN